ncbi:hypothetical protein OVN18_10765 [Microcella daejeonensis]|uniref:Uncharacterized protein n=1 Tax=Microcella daejeonensis TaxID=2994971 RepID=A0A9E8MK37_9MICO|nr:hypothetical protein [Microcella daejeonensis]WAB81030.1 hypothetical protein OVN18_10765 [Microcella daejeonensis]
MRSPTGHPRPPAHDDEPLRSDEQVLDRVARLVGAAIRPQLWLMMLDPRDRQLPLLVPVEGIPAHPELDAVDGMARIIEQLARSAGAASVVAVLERPGGEHPDRGVRAWGAVLVDAAAEAGIPLRALLLAHDAGVLLLGIDDL